MNADDLQRLIDGELKQLPAPRAPGSLLPRVLAATEARQPAPWYSLPWLAWPRVWQVASLAAVVVVCAALVLGWNAWQQAPAQSVSAVAAQAQSRPQTAPTVVLSAAALMRLCWRLLLVPAAVASLVFTLVLSLACAAIWAALDRVSLGASHQ